jgi:hypothetical protein
MEHEIEKLDDSRYARRALFYIGLVLEVVFYLKSKYSDLSIYFEKSETQFQGSKI